MGLFTADVVRLLSLFKEKGTENKSLCLIGKQNIHVEWAPFMEMVGKFEFPYDKEIYGKIKNAKRIDAYDFFRMFGFAEVHAVDVSPIR